MWFMYTERLPILQKNNLLNQIKLILYQQRQGAPPTTISLWLYHTILPINNFRSDDQSLPPIPTLTSVGIEDRWMPIAGHQTSKVSREKVVKSLIDSD